MKKSLLLIAIVAFATLSGCRREDIREFTVEMPSLTFDFDKKTLTMKYDSMKIAQTNIRMLIESKGVEVHFPSNTTGVAGYLDVKPKSVE